MIALYRVINTNIYNQTTQ
jgi:hypothetical protein